MSLKDIMKDEVKYAVLKDGVRAYDEVIASGRSSKEAKRKAKHVVEDLWGDKVSDDTINEVMSSEYFQLKDKLSKDKSEKVS